MKNHLGAVVGIGMLAITGVIISQLPKSENVLPGTVLQECKNIPITVSVLEPDTTCCGNDFASTKEKCLVELEKRCKEVIPTSGNDCPSLKGTCTNGPITQNDPAYKQTRENCGRNTEGLKCGIGDGKYLCKVTLADCFYTRACVPVGTAVPDVELAV